MDYDEWQEICKAFQEEDKKEMSKTKSKVRVKTKHSDKIRSEKHRQELKKNILNTLTHDMHRYKRVAASLNDNTSTRFRKAVSNFRQQISEL
jgi:DNA-binding transcriptional regulator GbsR (MarR family)